MYPGHGDVPFLVIWEDISLWEGVMVLKEYFSLGGCAGPVKMSKYVMLLKRCQMSKSQISGLWRRFTKKLSSHNEVHIYWHQFWRQKYEGNQNCSKTLSMNILSIFGHHHMRHQNWHQYVWTSLCQFIFLCTSSIVHVFNFLTFDIFLTTWHLFDNLTSFLIYGQWDTWANGYHG